MYGLSPACALLLPGVWLAAVGPAGAVEVYTSGALEAVNGTDVRLKCTFSSFLPVGSGLTVTWNFRPESGGPEEFVFYYHEQPYAPARGHFKGRVVWDGNINRNDVSIIVWHMQFDDNGTFTCQVKNPPDVDGLIGEIQLRVVQTVRFSEMYLLALAIGCACALMVILVIAVVLVQHFRKTRHQAHVVETESKEEEKLNQEKVSISLEDTH
ncbi:myelin protein zero-like protein 2 [Tachyglossus aculeatus]|uniref:myelin protein zero-like protein 2 n=1 Tax=Tachyglossus aculeatus TaxID=9261 RepID=UPI0018F3B0AF|nr:myelin protein zero-like protein 2 [Tachyglossus aculeatus]XP_038610002.1 myelin protein zero-like protein 2 [Tachyglossus aculeatus]